MSLRSFEFAQAFWQRARREICELMATDAVIILHRIRRPCISPSAGRARRNGPDRRSDHSRKASRKVVGFRDDPNAGFRPSARHYTPMS
jgi:hypothetical protein